MQRRADSTRPCVSIELSAFLLSRHVLKVAIDHVNDLGIQLALTVVGQCRRSLTAASSADRVNRARLADGAGAASIAGRIEMQTWTIAPYDQGVPIGFVA